MCNCIEIIGVMCSLKNWKNFLSEHNMFSVGVGALLTAHVFPLAKKSNKDGMFDSWYLEYYSPIRYIQKISLQGKVLSKKKCSRAGKKWAHALRKNVSWALQEKSDNFIFAILFELWM